ncbi:MAG TPA: hypothetical protein VFA40_08140 [Terriglobales bacterium]|nr:hypothetical protein [Terriglobales bacterium]
MGRINRQHVAQLSVGLLLFLLPVSLHAQDLAKRLILKDGSYQSVTKYEVKGERVRYLSAERGEWEEIPKSMVNWPATEKYEKDRAAGASTPEAAELDKELEADREAQEALSPQVVPGLALPEEGGVFLLDTYESRPELVPLDQRGGAINKNMKGNILRAAVNPIASAHQTVEVPGKHSPLQAHVQVPSLYINIDRGQESDAEESAAASKQNEPSKKDDTKKDQKPSATDRFRIIRLEAKGDKRVVGEIKVAVYGKISQDAKFVPTTTQAMKGGWVKVTPTDTLPSGEYAVVEMLGKEGMNLYVWDFGVNPNAPANSIAFKQDPSGLQAKPESIELQKRKQ